MAAGGKKGTVRRRDGNRLTAEVETSTGAPTAGEAEGIMGDVQGDCKATDSPGFDVSWRIRRDIKVERVKALADSA